MGPQRRRRGTDLSAGRRLPVRARAGALVLVAALLVPIAVGAWRAPVWPMDEGAVLVYPQLFRQGEQPHRDFETFYGPGNVWVLAGVYVLTRPTFAVERLAGLAYRMAIVAAVVVLAWPAGVLVTAVAALVAGSIAFALGLPAFAWLGALALALAGMACLATARRSPGDHRLRWVIGGALLGAAVVYRLDLALGVIGAAAVTFLAARRGDRLRLLAGLTVAPLGYAVHLGLAGPAAVARGMVLDLARQSPGRRLPLPPHRVEVAALLALDLIGVAALVVGGAAARRRGRAEGDVALALGLLCVGALPQALQRAEAFHVGSAAVVCVGLLPLGLAHLRGSLPRVNPRWLAAAVTTALAGVVIGTGALAAPAVLRPAVDYGERALGALPSRWQAVHRGGRWAVLNDAHEAGALRGLLRDVTAVTRPGQRIFVGPANLRRTNYNDTYIYGLLPELVPASYFLEMNPDSANRPRSRLAADVATANVVILTTAYDGWREPNDSTRDGPAAPLDTLAQHFCLRSEHPPWRLLVRCR